MSEVNLDFVERYQEVLRKDPKSKVFAPLAEAYRKMGLIRQALEVARKGVELHPHLASGRVALGRALTENNQLDEALVEFKKAIEISPDNLLAHSCLGKAQLQLGQPKAALKSYKMVLFLNPNDEEAQKVIAKLESLTADEYDDDVFAMTDLKSAMIEPPSPPPPPREDFAEKKTHFRLENRALMRALSLADAFIIRNEVEKAESILAAAAKEFGPLNEIKLRQQMIAERLDFDENGEDEEQAQPIRPLSYRQLVREEKEFKLRALLHRVAAHKKSKSPS